MRPRLSEHDLARDNIFNELSAQPNLSVKLDPFIWNSNTYYNVVATLTGTDVPEDIYVVGAHFDTANNPGADDDGTGTAIVMEVARVLCRYRSPAPISAGDSYWRA
ncbi:MAG: M28 family peptidase [Chloroflexi bacterium]|nr:M28 family peptidase [Chloroflexota bacterium]